eukprot:CAMPEP_0183378128 /NCGR_PEP_ID=MMETSP0164_2-20130417/124754_1 /TAXON_ID=221442 /ORGANISM="Coccolithus pelagicus ssp braarudi, Strain PLY182g" /LENGTH=54 /DNA_ID=CAMNT_0025555671 /DNA_START=940 /DNA_END=1101 /DNA_ORIENTATION=-
MPAAEHLARIIHRHAQQGLGLVKRALVMEEVAQVADRDQRVRVAVAERLASRGE